MLEIEQFLLLSRSHVLSEKTLTIFVTTGRYMGEQKYKIDFYMQQGIRNSSAVSSAVSLNLLFYIICLIIF